MNLGLFLCAMECRTFHPYSQTSLVVITISTLSLLTVHWAHLNSTCFFLRNWCDWIVCSDLHEFNCEKMIIYLWFLSGWCHFSTICNSFVLFTKCAYVVSAANMCECSTPWQFQKTLIRYLTAPPPSCSCYSTPYSKVKNCENLSFEIFLSFFVCFWWAIARAMQCPLPTAALCLCICSRSLPKQLRWHLFLPSPAGWPEK